MGFKSLSPKVRFAAYIPIVLALWVPLLWWAKAYDFRQDRFLPPALRIPGIVLFVLGSVLSLTCVWLFLTVGEGTPALWDSPRKFVRRGPYRYVRNPMVLGGTAMLFGIACFFGSPTQLLIGFIFFLGMDLYIVMREEPDLKRRFGTSYEDYLKEIPRWIPGFRKKGRPRAG